MNVKDLSRGSWRVMLIYLIAGIISFIVIFGLLIVVPLSGSLGLVLAMVIAILVSYFVCRWLVPFSKYPENAWYKYGRWTGLAVFISLSGQSVIRHASFILAHNTEPVNTWAGQEVALMIALTTIFALIAGYIGARSKKSSVAILR